jgi:hypothetical protein
MVILLLGVLTAFAIDTSNVIMPTQGMLKTPAGAPVLDGPYTMVFRIFKNSTGGSPLWTETQTVQLKDGLYTVMLGSVTKIPDTALVQYPGDDSSRYLQTAVNTETLLPRLQLGSVPRAMSSRDLWGGSVTTGRSGLAVMPLDTGCDYPAFEVTVDTGIYDRIGFSMKRAYVDDTVFSRMSVGPDGSKFTLGRSSGESGFELRNDSGSVDLVMKSKAIDPGDSFSVAMHVGKAGSEDVSLTMKAKSGTYGKSTIVTPDSISLESTWWRSKLAADGISFWDLFQPNDPFRTAVIGGFDYDGTEFGSMFVRAKGISPSDTLRGIFLNSKGGSINSFMKANPDAASTQPVMVIRDSTGDTLAIRAGGITFNDGSIMTTATVGSSCWVCPGSYTILSDITDRVGIGTTTPSAKLDVDATGTASLRGAEFRNNYSSTGGVGVGAAAVTAQNTNLYGIALNAYTSSLDATAVLGNDSTSGGILRCFGAGSAVVFEVDADGKTGVNTYDPTAAMDVYATTGYNQVRMRTSFTPTGTADARGNVGDIAWDNSYMYVKTVAGWKRTALSTW